VLRKPNVSLEESLANLYHVACIGLLNTPKDHEALKK
jgi:hypothetical protein